MDTPRVVLFSFMVFFLFCNACTSTSSKGRNAIVVDLDKVTVDMEDFYFLDYERELDHLEHQADTITMNTIAKSIEMICLEVTKESLLSSLKFTIAEVKGDYYVSSGVFHTSSGVIRFDDQGNYKEKLIEVGRGPLELPYVTHWSVNDSLNTVSMFGAETKLVTYNTCNREKRSLWIDKYGYNPILLNDSLYVAYEGAYPNKNSDLPYLNFFDFNGKVIHSCYYPKGHEVGYEILESHPRGIIYEGYGIFQDNKGNALLKDVFNDTIYRAKSMSDISPYICTYRGRMTPLHDFATDIRRQSSAIYIHRLLETKGYFFISHLYNKTKQTTVWDKETKKIIARTVIVDQRSREFNYEHVVRYRTPNGDILFLNMVYAKGNTIYGVLRAEDAVKFVPHAGLDANPMLVKIVL